MGEEIQLNTFLASVLDGGESRASFSGRFTPISRWVGPKTNMDAMVKGKIP